MHTITIEKLSDSNDARIANYIGLKNHTLRTTLEQEQNIMIVESKFAIERAILSNIEPISVLVAEEKIASVSALLEMIPPTCTVYTLPKRAMSELTGFEITRGILSEMRRPALCNPYELVGISTKVAVLESIVDTTNVGALFRSAAALGADAILLADDCADPLARRSIRVSMGTVFQVPFARFEHSDWPHKALDTLKQQGFSCIAMALDKKSVPLSHAIGSNNKRALFFGGEGYGLSKAVIDFCDCSVMIPMANGVDSLNVAASAAVAFWELFSKDINTGS